MSATMSTMAQRALERGDWIVVKDDRHRDVYYNPSTNEATRDLSRHLLEAASGQLTKPRSEAAAATNKQPSTAPSSAALPSGEEQLKQARALNDAYEFEVTYLRHCLMKAKTLLSGSTTSAGEPSSTFVAQHKDIDLLFSSSQKTLLTKREKANVSDTDVMREQIETTRRLQAKLYNRIVTDREAKHLCPRCMCDVLSRSDDADASTFQSLAPIGAGYPRSLLPFSNIPVDELMIRALGTKDSIGFLPQSHDPMSGLKSGATGAGAGLSTSAGLHQTRDRPGTEPQQARADHHHFAATHAIPNSILKPKLHGEQSTAANAHNFMGADINSSSHSSIARGSSLASSIPPASPFFGRTPHRAHNDTSTTANRTGASALSLKANAVPTSLYEGLVSRSSRQPSSGAAL